MKYFPNLSNTLNAEIFVDNKGLVYLQRGSNMHNIGNVNTDNIATLRANAANY